MRTSSRLTALLLFEEIDLLDVALVSSILSSAGRKWNFRPFKIAPVAARPGAVDTRSQVQLSAARALEECAAPEIVVVPGGYGARRALADERVVHWLDSAGRGATELVATGHGVLLAAKAGLLADTDVAAGRESLEELARMAPSCRPHSDEPFRVSGKVTTALSSFGTARAALSIVKRLLGEKHASEIATELGLPPETAPQKAVEIIETR